MKITYLFTSPSLRGSSVQTKVLSQIKYLNQAGAKCRGAFFSTEAKEIAPLNDFVDLIPVEKCDWKYFKNFGQRRNTNKSLLTFIQANFSKTDLFYLRYPGISKGLLKLVKKYGRKIVSEHQSKEIDEIRSFKNEHPFGFRISKLLSWFIYFKYPIYLEKRLGRKYLQNVKSVICVTKEIADYQKRRGARLTIVAPNGIQVNKYSVKEQSHFSLPLRLLFLKGTSSNSLWNGLERIIASIDNLQQPSKYIKLIICGHKIENEIPNRDYMEHLGYKNKEELDDIINSIHLGVSTMALYKKNLNQAAVLKTREYVARGLPFIYAYDDPDLHEDAKIFSLKFPNNDSLIDFHEVIDFAKKALTDENLSYKMRQYAQKNLDYVKKAEILFKDLSFLDSID